MIENSADFLPSWMVLSAAFGLIVGEAWGNNSHHRKCLEQANEDLRDQLQKAHPCEEQLHQALKQQRSVINDIHKHVVAVSKPSRNTPPNSNKINGRISSIWPCHKVRVYEQTGERGRNRRKSRGVVQEFGAV